MGVRELSPDEEVLPLGATPPPAAAKPRPRLRALASDEQIFPLGSKPPPVPYEPTLADTLFGRTDVGGNKQVEGLLPDLGDAALETGKDIGAGIMRGGAATGDLALTGMRKLTNWYSQASPEDVARGEAEQEEGRRSAREFFTPEQQTPAGRVLGGLGEIALPLAATAGNPALLVASEYERRKKDLVEQGVDEETADKIAALHGISTAVGAKLPIAGKTLGTRLLTGGAGNASLAEVEREKTQSMLQEKGYDKQAQAENFNFGDAAVNTLMGLVFGAVHHAASGAEASAGSAPRAEGPAPLEAELVPPGPRKPPPGGPGVTVEGETIRPAYPELPPPPPGPSQQIPRDIPNRGKSPIEQETELANMGLTPDVIGNIIKLEDEAEARKAGRVLPAPDTTLVAGPDGQMRPAVDVEAQARTEARGRDLLAKQAEDRAKAEAARKESLGLTPDVEANNARLAQRQQDFGTTVTNTEPQRLGDALVPPQGTDSRLSVPPAEPPIGEALVPSQKGEVAQTPTADQQVARPTPGETTVQTPKTIRPLREGEEILPLKGQKTPAKAKKPQSALQFLASKGGINIAALEKEGLDRADMQRAPGFRRPFTKKGMTLDAAAEALHEAGYDVADEAGRPDANKALAVIDAELRHGKKALPRGAQPVGEAKPLERRAGTELRAGEERRAPPPRETPDRRGQVGERRKPVAEMNLEEARKELLTSHLTGLPNKRAYEERSHEGKHQGSVDVDSLKWVNDNMGHGSGDELLKAVGTALKEAAGDNAYHLSGDEFAVEGKDAAELHDIMERVNERLAQATIEITKADGSKITLDGLGVSYGLGETLDAADQNLSVAKQTREAQGVRAPRGEKPVGASVSGGRDEAGSDHGDNAPTGGEVAEPGVDYRAAADESRADVEHVTLTGEGHVSHVSRGEGEHVEAGGEEPRTVEEQRKSPRPASGRMAQLEHEKSIVEALAEVEKTRPSTTAGDDARTHARGVIDRYVAKYGEDAFSNLLDRLDRMDQTGKFEGPPEGEPKPPAPMKKPAPGKTGDLFTQEDARPGTMAAQIRLANELLDQLERDATGPPGEITPIAVAFNKEFRSDEAASFVGKKISGPEDLGYLAQIFRDPRFETLRYFFLNDEGKIVGQNILSARLPGSSSAFPGVENTAWVRAQMKRTGATRLIMQHNHPSGSPLPSDADYAITQRVARDLGILVEHVIVDSKEFATFDSDHTDQPFFHEVPGPDPVHGKHSMPHKVLGRHIVNTDDAARIAKELEKPDDWIGVVGMAGARGNVRAIGDVPRHLLEVTGEGTHSRLEKALRTFGVQHGNQMQVLVGVNPAWLAKNYALAENLINDGFLVDVIDTEGRSVYQMPGARPRPESVQKYGTTGMAKEIKPREPEPEAPKPPPAAKRGGVQQDLLGDKVETKNELARAESAKSAKRSPNKDVSPDQGIPGDLFTKQRQQDLLDRAHKYAATEPFKKWFGDSKVVDDEGEPLVVYHGTTHDVSEFSSEKGNPESDFGAGFYFTDNMLDADRNYAGQGADLEGKLERRIEALDNEHFGDSDWSHEKSNRQARRELMPNKGVVMPVFLKMEKPFELGGPHETRLTHEYEYEDPSDPDSEIVGEKGTLPDLMRALEHEANAAGVDAHDAITRMAEYGDGIPASRVLEFMKADEKLSYAEGDNGELIAHEVMRKALERAGFDGVIDRTPDEKWGTGSGRVKQMPHLQGTSHYIAFDPKQVKSAIGNKGTFDPESGNIVEQERPRYRGERRTDQRRARDERGGRRGGDVAKSQKGDRGYAAVAQKAIDAFNKKIGWRYGPMGRLPEQKRYLEERYKALGAVKAGQELAHNTYKALREATPEDAAATYEYLTNKNGDPTAIGDPAVRKAARDAKRVIDEMGQRLVDRGLLSQEAYDEHKGEYLPRLYLKHVLGDAVSSAIGGGKKLSDLGYLKPRQDIPEEVRKVILGEITDPAFLASFGISRTQRDLALVDFLHAIAGRELWTPKHSTVEWRGRQVTPFYLADEARALRKRAAFYSDPKAKAAALKMADEAQRVSDEGLAKLEARPDPSDFEQIPNSKRYGALRGLYVRKEIYNDLVGAQGWVPPGSSVAEALLGSGGLMARAQSWWKLSKVILNPPTQVRNFVANMMLLHLSGVPFHRVYSGEIIGKAINSLASKDRFYQIAKKYGLFAATFANTEGARIRDEWLALQDMKGGGLAKLRAFAGRGVNAASDFYQLMEAIGKIAKIRDAMEREGKSPADAVLEAHEALFDYSLVPRSVQYLRNAPVGAPFLTFTYKAAAQMAKIAVKHPERFAPYIAIPFLMAALIKNSYDVSDDDLKKLKEAFPQWMKQRGHMLLLPYKDARGRWQNVDMGYLTPWGQFADMAAQAKEGGGVGKLAGSLVFSGPMMDVANAIQTNVDPFTGKPIVDDRDPPADKLQSMMQYAWNLAAPGWLTEQGALNQLRRSLTGQNLNKKTGEPGMTPTQASLRLLGLNVYPANPELTRDQNLAAMRTNLEQSKQRMGTLLRDQNLSDKERNDIRDTWTKLIEARAKEIELYQRGSEINPKLK